MHCERNDCDLSVNIIFIRCLSFPRPLRRIIQGYEVASSRGVAKPLFFSYVYTTRYIAYALSPSQLTLMESSKRTKQQRRRRHVVASALVLLFNVQRVIIGKSIAGTRTLYKLLISTTMTNRSTNSFSRSMRLPADDARVPRFNGQKMEGANRFSDFRDGAQTANVVSESMWAYVPTCHCASSS